MKFHLCSHPSGLTNLNVRLTGKRMKHIKKQIEEMFPNAERILYSDGLEGFNLAIIGFSEVLRYRLIRE